MNKVFEEILWTIYYQTENKVGPRGDARFILHNLLRKDLHNFAEGKILKAFRDLEKKKFLEKKSYEESVLVSLTEKGMLRAINYGFRRLERKKENWDGKWRMVAFDMPRACQKGRKAFVYRLKMGGFYELQESIFVYPYDCKEEIDAFLKLFKLEKYVRFGILDFIDIQDKLRFHFKLE
jgi:DNA-binding transcriptional regulator PaaX